MVVGSRGYHFELPGGSAAGLGRRCRIVMYGCDVAFASARVEGDAMSGGGLGFPELWGRVGLECAPIRRQVTWGEIYILAKIFLSFLHLNVTDFATMRTIQPRCDQQRGQSKRFTAV